MVVTMVTIMMVVIHHCHHLAWCSNQWVVHDEPVNADDVGWYWMASMNLIIGIQGRPGGEERTQLGSISFRPSHCSSPPSIKHAYFVIVGCCFCCCYLFYLRPPGLQRARPDSLQAAAASSATTRELWINNLVFCFSSELSHLDGAVGEPNLPKKFTF